MVVSPFCGERFDVSTPMITPAAVYAQVSVVMRDVGDP